MEVDVQGRTGGGKLNLGLSYIDLLRKNAYNSPMDENKTGLCVECGGEARTKRWVVGGP